MQIGVVKGTVVASNKVSQLEGLALKILVPTDSQGNILGDPLVAADVVGAREGDRVLWVGKREASLAIPQAELANLYPLDAAITGIIDDIG